MPWIIGGGVLYLVLVVTLGVLCARNGHWIMFVLGFFFPFLWLIGAVLRPVFEPRLPRGAVGCGRQRHAQHDVACGPAANAGVIGRLPAAGVPQLGKNAASTSAATPMRPTPTEMGSRSLEVVRPPPRLREAAHRQRPSPDARPPRTRMHAPTARLPVFNGGRRRSINQVQNRGGTRTGFLAGTGIR